CLLAKKAGADFVKTSTGFANGGATVSDVSLMRQVVGTKMGVKASGGIRTREDAVNMLRSGANRIGTSNAVSMMNEK
ncbi:MAG TPA: 2-deoxyribose-5-phosphate aldolase, partial [Candidatus Cloacimonadota bacterium]|nr:2-deoxyribose-5-phosphate aldolase [Candidatus Cloacimonadota bacterium]